MSTFKIYTTVDGLGGRAVGSGWAHGRIINGQWKEIEYHSRESAQRAINDPQFNGRGAYATDGESMLYPQI